MNKHVSFQKMVGTGFQDGSIGISGKAVAVWGINIQDDGFATDFELHNGTEAGGEPPIYMQSSTNTTIPLGFGIVFPNGCFALVNSNGVGGITVFYEQLSY